MPRQSRIDAPGALHHIMARGIERCSIFKNDTDRDDFLERLEKILLETQTPCYAWALIPNHFHLLLRTGSQPISTVMRRLLSGYAQSFNRRHNRHGHLFQNRYKSILCQERAYLLELVRYIHLNPLRSGVVRDLRGLNPYKYCGHGVLLGKHQRAFQHTDLVLKTFSGSIPAACKKYRAFVQKGITMGQRQDLSGGGLVRSAGGWGAVKMLRESKLYQKADERILGDGDFVEKALHKAGETQDPSYTLRAKGWNLDKIIRYVASILDIPMDQVKTNSKRPISVKARAVVCYWAHQGLKLRQSDIASQFGISQPAVCAAIPKGKKIVQKDNLLLVEIGKIKYRIDSDINPHK